MALNGTVERWWPEKGFGFITSSEIKGDVFVHHSDIERERRGRVDLTPGDQVEFEIAKTEKGNAARKVRVVG